MDKLRLGFIGTGGVAYYHGLSFPELENVELAAIADVSEQSRRSFMERLNLEENWVAQYDDYLKMLAECRLDGVIICSPHTLHFAQAMDAIRHGCHVLVEKPMTCTSAEAEQLLAAAEKAGKVLQVSYQRHFQPEFLYIKQAIDSGEIGKLTSVTVSLCQDWRNSQTNTWRHDPKLSGGGMLMDSGSHILDALLWTTGLTPVEVKTQIHRQGAPVEIDSFTSIRFAEGAIAGVNIVGHFPGWYESWIFCGETGAILFAEGKLTLRKFDGEAIRPDLPGQTTNPDKSFVDAIRGKHEVLVPGTFGLKVAKLTEMIYEAGNYKP